MMALAQAEAMQTRSLFLLVMLVVSVAAATAEDWPQFLGPLRNGEYSGPDISTRWPVEGPPFVWKKSVGQGFSGPVVSGGRLILFHRLDDREIVECLNAKTGDSIWRFEYPTEYRDDFGFDEGPRATPAIVDGKVYTFGADGALHCLRVEDGRKLWNVPVKTAFRARKGFFGFACSPVVEGDHVLLNVGGDGNAGIVAFDKTTGEVKWRSTSDEASYSSPVVTTVNGNRLAVFFTRDGLVLLDPLSGEERWRYPWRSRMHASVNAATPLVVGDSVFLSASYGVGAVVLSLSRREKLWASDDALSNHYATSVHRNGFLYGFHGRQETGPSFRCIELSSGKVRWEEENMPAGTVTRAGDHLLLLLEDGRLMLADASPEKWTVRGQAQILPMGVRAYPAIADGLLYARGKGTLICVRLDLE